MKLFNRLFCRNRGFVPRSVTIITPDYRLKWISVKDRLPEVEDGSDAVKVLVYYNCAVSHTMEIGATYFWKDSLLLSENGLPYGFELLGVTHWMPLPDAPITKNEEDKNGNVGDDTM
jgi:hypothetical protein